MAFLRSVIRCSLKQKYGFNLNTLQNGTFGRVDVNQIALKSTVSETSTKPSPSAPTPSASTSPRDPLDISFEDAKAAFKSKTTWELYRAYIVYTLCSFEYLVEHNMKVMLHRLTLIYPFIIIVTNVSYICECIQRQRDLDESLIHTDPITI